jgi:hypothetical protein
MCLQNHVFEKQDSKTLQNLSHKCENFYTWHTSDMCKDLVPTSQRKNCLFMTKTNGVLQRVVILIYSKGQTEHIKTLCVQ